VLAFRIAIRFTACLFSFVTAVAATRTFPEQSASVEQRSVGSAIVMGIVVSDDNLAQPISQATVRLSGANLPVSQLIVTGRDGRFAFTHLPSGKFTLSAKKAAYVESFYGASKPGRGPGIPIAVAAGQQVSVSVRLVKGAVITGLVTDRIGKPAVQITVQATLLSGASQTTSALTDDTGTYRIYGLTPGPYVIAALGRLPTSEEVREISPEEIRWAQARLRSLSSIANAPDAPPSTRPLAHTTTYFTGTSDLSAAAIVSVESGQEHANVDFQVQFVPTAVVGGRIVDGGGQPVASANLVLAVRSSQGQDARLRLLPVGTRTSKGSAANGTFNFSGVPSGEYILFAKTTPSLAANDDRSNPTILWARQALQVAGLDQSNLVVALKSGARVTGTIVLEGSQTPDLSPIRVQAIPSTENPLLSDPPAVSVDGGNKFSLTNLPPNEYLVRTNLPAQMAKVWTLKSVTVDGRDITDALLPLGPEEAVNNVVITLTDRATRLSGIVVDRNGQPVPEVTIVIFPVDRRAWVQPSRRIHATRPATDGSYVIAGVPSGEYCLAAAIDFDSKDLFDPGFLDELQRQGFKVTLVDGESKTQDLRVGIVR